MTVADLNDVELLDDAAIQHKFLLLELRQDCATKVDPQYVKQLVKGFYLAIVPFDITLHVTDVVAAFEKRAHSFLALGHILDVRLGVEQLFLGFLLCVLNPRILFNSGSERV